MYELPGPAQSRKLRRGVETCCEVYEMNACTFSCQFCCHYRPRLEATAAPPNCEISRPGFPLIGDRCRAFLYNPRGDAGSMAGERQGPRLSRMPIHFHDGS
jgi:hypothetical protein